LSDNFVLVGKNDHKIALTAIITLAVIFGVMVAGEYGFAYWWPAVFLVGFAGLAAIVWIDRKSS